MKNFLTYLAAFLFVSASCVASTVSITFNIDAGILANKNGVAIPDGSLVLLIASPTGSGFSTSVNEGSYVSGDAVIVADFALTTINDPGEAVATLYNYSVESGYQLALRWFPGVTDAQYKNALFSPVAGLYYGTCAGATTGSPDGGDPWLASGAALSLNFWTTAIGGSQDPSAGYATLQLLAVPEPTSLALLVTGGLLVTGTVLRRRRKVA